METRKKEKLAKKLEREENSKQKEKLKREEEQERRDKQKREDINWNNIKIIIFEPFISSDRFNNIEVEKELTNFIDRSDIIIANKLEFVGWSDFNINRKLKKIIFDLYSSKYKDDFLKKNLDNWNTFEEENPIIFSTRYKFWIRKND